LGSRAAHSNSAGGPANCPTSRVGTPGGFTDVAAAAPHDCEKTGVYTALKSRSLPALAALVLTIAYIRFACSAYFQSIFANFFQRCVFNPSIFLLFAELLATER
jgi:hypothetical protein